MSGSLEDTQDFEPDDDSIVLEGTEVVPEYVILRVKVVRNDDDTANIYQINGVNQPTFHLLKVVHITLICLIVLCIVQHLK